MQRTYEPAQGDVVVQGLQRVKSGDVVKATAVDGNAGAAGAALPATAAAAAAAAH